MARTKALARDTKKARLLRLLEEHRGAVPLSLAAKELYGKDGRLEREKVVRLLSAYRTQGDRMWVRKGKVVGM